VAKFAQLVTNALDITCFVGSKRAYYRCLRRVFSKLGWLIRKCDYHHKAHNGEYAYGFRQFSEVHVKTIWVSCDG